MSGSRNRALLLAWELLVYGASFLMCLVGATGVLVAIGIVTILQLGRAALEGRFRERMRSLGS